jgi:excisionase family DNA binding protein
MVLTVLLCSVPATRAQAAQPDPCSTPVLTLDEAAALLRVELPVLEQLAKDGQVPARSIGGMWRFECAALLAWVRNGSPAVPDVSGRGLSRPQVPDRDTPPQQSGDADTSPAIGEAPPDRSAEDVFLRGNRLLLGRGEVVLDVGQVYGRRDVLQLAVIGSGVTLATVQQSSFTTVVFGRVGILRETEAFAGATFTRQTTQQFSSGVEFERANRSVFGPATLGVRHTLLRESAKRPDVVVSVSGQVPTSDLLPAAGAGLILVKSIDPVVLFANANYAHPFTRSGSARQPIDTVDLSLGYGLGLNDATAISMAVGGIFTGISSRGAPAVDAPAVNTPAAFSIRFGVTTALGRGLYLEPSVSLGISGPAQTFAFGLTMPYAF